VGRFNYESTVLDSGLRIGVSAGALRVDQVAAGLSSPSEAVLPYLQWLIQQDRKLTPLKELQGLVWADGYARGELQAPLFRDVPEALRTPELCLEAVREDGRALSEVPQELRTLEVCMEAVRQAGWVLQHVPEAQFTPELCMEAARGHHFALEDVPEPLRSPELCWEAVRRAGSALQYVPEALRTSELCLEAVRRTCSALEDVPEALRTPDLYLKAVREYGWALQYEQLSPGQFKGRIHQVQLPEVTLLREDTSIALRQRGRLDESVYGFAMALQDSPDLFFNGQRAPAHASEHSPARPPVRYT
jgi:hypothetical protein